MTTPIPVGKSRLFAVSLHLVLGALCTLGAKALLRGLALDPSTLQSILTGVQTLAVAMTGIMAGFFAIVTSTQNSFWIERFKACGLMREFVFLYQYTIAALLLTYMLALCALARPALLAWCLGFLLADLLYVGLVMHEAHSIKHNANDPDAD